MRIQGKPLTPSLFLTEDRDEGDVATILSGGRAFVSDPDRAREMMAALGVPDEAIEDNIRRATQGLSEAEAKQASFDDGLQGDSVNKRFSQWVTKHLPGEHDQKDHGNRRSVTQSKFLRGRIDKTGGYTYQPILPNTPTEGFAVSILPDDEVMTFGKPTRSNIATFIDRHRDKLEASERLHAGAWFDSDTGRGYLDMSVVVGDKDEAQELAKRHDQKAFIDLKTFDEYDQDGNLR